VRGLKIAPVVILAVAVSGCNMFGGRGRSPTTRPITVVLVKNGSSGTCEPKYGQKPYHANPGDTIDWEFINTCDSDKTVVLSPKDAARNPFTTNPPWSTTAHQNNGPNPDVLSLLVAQNAAGLYRFNITVDGRDYDPKLEIDP
jgi:hypothetical protein